MKFFSAVLIFAALQQQAFAATGNKKNGQNLRRLKRPQTKECEVLMIAELHLPEEAERRRLAGEDTGSETLECVLDPDDADGIANMAYPIVATPAQIEVIKNKMNADNNGQSKKFYLEASPSTTVDGGAVELQDGAYVGINEKSNANANANANAFSRNLASTGNKPILVVRVTDLDGKVRPENAGQIGDDIFGTLGDPVNMKSQFYDCSFGQLNIVNDYSVDISDDLAAPGVIEVTIDKRLAVDDRNTVHNAVTAAVQTKLGFNLPGPFEQVMYVVEGCYVGCGYAAYAYVNSWMSVYQAGYYKMVGVLLHEIGHNLGLAHSGGLDGATYTDHTGMMGNPLYSDDVGKMCFNAAKSWQLGWYDTNKETVDPQVTGSWTNTLVGIADYDNNPQNNPVLVKVETGTATDLFVAFNRATGVNSQNDEADNEVTVVQSGQNGEAYSQSFLQAHLLQGESHVIANFAGTGNDLTITANAIDISANPGFADITIELAGAPTPAPVPITASPTAAPVTASPTTASPTPAPITASPTPAPTTAIPTTASPTPAPTTASPTASPTPIPTAAPTTASPTPACTLAQVNESCNKGRDCCSGSCSGGKPSSRKCLA